MQLTFTKEVKGLVGDHAERCESVSLRLERLAEVPTQDNDHSKKELERMVTCARKHTRLPGVPALPPSDDVRTRILKLGGRLILNQNSGIIENAGLQLHRHWGCPYIAGSSVKGIARLGATLAQATPADMDAVFGPEDGDHVKGAIAFIPAFPVDKPTLVVDIVNCHHPDYYKGKRPTATDDENPIPNFFLAVEAGPAFIFQLALSGLGRRESEAERSDVLRKAEEWLVLGLTEYGVGGKTAAGYGWFMESPEEEQAALASFAKARQDHQDRLKEAERVENLSPEARAAEAYWKTTYSHMPDQGAKGNFKGDLNNLNDMDEQVQQNMLLILTHRYSDIWSEILDDEKSIKDLEAQVNGLQKQQDKKSQKKLQKAQKRLDRERNRSRADLCGLIRRIAENLGIDLP